MRGNIRKFIVVGTFKRDELIAIRKKADARAAIPGLNPHWKRAYERLSMAADHLDAMSARSIVRGEAPQRTTSNEGTE